MSPFVFCVESGGKLFLQSHSLAECLNMPRLPRPAAQQDTLGATNINTHLTKNIACFMVWNKINSFFPHALCLISSLFQVDQPHQAIFLHCIYISSCTNRIKGCNVEYWRSLHSLKEFVRTYREAAGQCPVYWHLMQLSTEDQNPAHPQWLFHYGTKQFCDIYRRHVTPHHGAPWYNSPGYNAQLGRRLWLDCRELGSLDITLNLTFFFVTD